MSKTIDLLLDNNKYVVNIYYIVNKDGNLLYKCELNGINISTFPYRKDYSGNTEDEAIKKIAKELRIAINALLEL